MSKDLDLKAIHETAINAAQTASKDYFNRYLHGVDQFPCGFAYVVINDNVRANSKLGKQLIELGFHKGHNSNRFERIIPSLLVKYSVSVRIIDVIYASIMINRKIKMNTIMLFYKLLCKRKL